jgi:hypothetical protein
LTFLGAAPGERVVQLELHRSKLGRVGFLNVIVRNDSSVGGRLRIRFYPENRGRAVPVEAPGTGTFPRLRPVLFSPRASITGKRLRLPPHRLVAVQLRLGVANDALANAANGVLIIDLRRHHGVQAAVLRVRANITAPKTATPSAQPKKVTLRVTRWLPLGIGDTHRSVDNSPRVWVPGKASQARTLISSSGDDAEVKLGGAETKGSAPAGLVQQRVKLIGGVNAGTYSGELPLVAGGSDKVSVEAQVRDFFLWPLFVLTVTAGIGGYGATWWQGKRRRDILVSELRRARNEYQNAFASRPPNSPVEALEARFPQADLEQLENDIASATESDEIDAVTKRVRAYRDAVSNGAKSRRPRASSCPQTLTRPRPQ